MSRFSPTWVFSLLSATLAAGYGVLFTIVGDYRDTYGISESMIGVLIGAGFISAFFSQLAIAPLADRGHARRLIVIGVLANVAGLLMMAFGESLTPLLTGRIISGVGIGAALPAVRRIVILSDPENLGENLGRLLSADVVGFATGPAISAVLVGPFGLAAPFLVVSGLTLVCLPFITLVAVTETRGVPGQRLALDLLRSRVVAGAVVMGAAVFLMIGAFDALWDVVHEDLETSTWLANLGITLFAVPLVILGPTSGRLAQRVGPFRVGSVGLLAGAGFMFAYGQLPTGGWIFAVAMVHAFSDGMTVASSGVAISMAVPEDRQAGAQGVMGAAQSLTAGVTAMIIGALYQGPGRAVAYATSSVGMLVLVVVGVGLAMPFIRDRNRSLMPEPSPASRSTEDRLPR
jgi:MFS transporter, DHA1 family, tetracycline resistance protein